MNTTTALLLLLTGTGVGICGSFLGLGGGFLMVPLLLFMGYAAQEAVGTSFVAILIISASALFAHHKFAQLDYKTGAVLGLGGLAGAQLDASLVQHISTAHFKKIFASILATLAVYLFFSRE